MRVVDYIDYALLKELSSDDQEYKVVLKFYKDDCPSCVEQDIILEPFLDSYDTIEDKYCEIDMLVYVDVNQYADYAKKLGVRALPTLIEVDYYQGKEYIESKLIGRKDMEKVYNYFFDILGLEE